MAVLAQATVQYGLSVSSHPLQLEGNMAFLTSMAHFLSGYLVNRVLAKRINTLGVMQKILPKELSDAVIQDTVL